MGPAMIALFLAFWLAGWLIAMRFRRPAIRVSAEMENNLSIIIPARNEAHNLPKLLQSILSQPVKPLEVLIVDDGSTDGTADVARRFGANVITSPPLPDGWRGKTWACHQGALKARGGLLLFMDADTWFEPGGLGRVLATGHDGALSIVPYHAVRRIHEDLSMFFNISMVAGTIPKGLVGPLLLVSRDQYQLAGGHESVRGNILENFRLAAKFQAVGVPQLSMTGKGIISFRMYPEGLRELLRGWTKGFAAGAGGTPAGSMVLVIAWMSGLVLAPLMLLLGGDGWTWGLACVLCTLQVAWIGRKLGSFGWLMLVIYPVPLMFFFGLFGWSAMKSGKSVTWKGREIHAD